VALERRRGGEKLKNKESTPQMFVAAWSNLAKDTGMEIMLW
jgi:hypothetical protein